MAMDSCILVLVFFSIIHANTALNIQCKKSNNCICIPGMDVFELQCPEKTPKIITEVQLRSEVINMQCMEKINWEDEDLPLIEAENVNRICFLRCSLPAKGFAGIMKKLRINGAKTLEVAFSGDLANVMLTSEYFEGLHKLEKLILHHNDIKNVDEEAFSSLNELSELDLSNNNIQLTDGLFKHLAKLKFLDLASNKLSRLPSKMFQNLTELKVLHLWSNRLTTIGNSTFKNLRNLELLELSRNQLEHLAEDAFHDLENLKAISLSSNNLRSIPENLFSNNVMLEFVTMSKNPDLTNLPNNLFAHLSKLKKVDLRECKLSNLPSDLFGGSTRLQKIFLQVNEIERIPGKIFANLVELQDLDLSCNKIRDLPDEAFSSLHQLKILNLENNLITNIRSEPFQRLQNLESLNLSKNRINSIDIGSFRGARNLKEIILANNYLSLSVGSILNHNLFLEKIDLSHNNITTVDDDFVLKVGLQELDLSYNQITYLTFSSFLTVSHTIKINLKHNNISTVNFDNAEMLAGVQENLEPFSSNRVVYLDGNPIKCDCYIYNFARYFDRSINPVVLNLVEIKADNLTCASPNDFTGFPVNKVQPSMLTCRLEDLETEGDFPENCEYAFRPWDKSLIVNCTGANLTEVPKLILPTVNFFNQTEVYLEKNLLTSGPKKNMGYENVTKLFLSSNNISKFAWLPPKIKVLELDNNNISYLSDNELSMLNTSSLTSLTLGNNPLNCDCTVENLKAYLVLQLVSKKVRIDINNITCKNGGEFLVHAGTNQRCSPYTYILMGFGVIFSLAMVAIIALMIFWIWGRPSLLQSLSKV